MPTKKYYKEHREELLEYSRNYAINNPEKVRKSKQENHKKNKKADNKRSRKYYKDNKDILMEKWKVKYYKNGGKERINAKNKEILEFGLTRSQASNLKRKFGITPAIFNALKVKQKGVCKICKKESIGRELAVDHCHETNFIRGLLCDLCNRMIGMAFEDIEILSSAIKYLKRNKKIHASRKNLSKKKIAKEGDTGDTSNVKTFTPVP